MLKLCVIFGGMSTEHDVSIASGKNVLENIENKKYKVTPIYINKNGDWFEYNGKYSELTMDREPRSIKKIENIIQYIKEFDVVFPVLHGLYGEDGSIQGMLELLKIPYVGCRILASSIGMDKAYAKVMFANAGINQTKSCYIKKYKEKYKYISKDFTEEIMNIDEICKKIQQKLKYPIFVKPSNSGSSVGVNKAETQGELKSAIIEAAEYDNKILIEEGIIGKEVECAVLGNEEVIAGEVGEIKAADSFYSYDAKYNNKQSKTLIPANISEEKRKEIKKLAIKAFKTIDGNGLARVDFFVEDKTGKIYLNEINTMPGFTKISMYPKLMEAIGVDYSSLLDELIKLSLNK